MSPAQTVNETLLLKQPTLSAEHIGFVYAGDIWVADLDGQHPRRLTAQKGRKLNPYFSPDGQSIAFSGDYDGIAERLCRPARGRLAPAADLPPRRGSGARLDARRSADPVRLGARVDHGARQAALYGAHGGRLAHAPPMPMAERAAYCTTVASLHYTCILRSVLVLERYRRR